MIHPPLRMRRSFNFTGLRAMASTVDSERTPAETYHLGLVAGVQNRRTHIHGHLLHFRKECLGLCYRCSISTFCAGWKDICRMYRELRSTTVPGESRVKMPLSGCFKAGCKE